MDIERFHFLKSSLSGPALAIIKSIPLAADNYNIEWNALQEVFEYNRLLATLHFDQLLESSVVLVSFLNTYRENVCRNQSVRDR